MISVAASSLPAGSPSAMGPPKCRPRTVAVVRPSAPSASIIWRESAGKAAWTPPDYSRGVLDVLELLGISLPDMLAGTHHIAHGTTSSLNALVTGMVPPVGFLTTKGHRDSIFIMNVEGRYLGKAPEEIQDMMRQAKPK